MGNSVIRPIFIDGAHNEPLYLQHLEETVMSTIIAALKNDGTTILFFSKMVHLHIFVLLIREYLDTKSPGQWIGPVRMPILYYSQIDGVRDIQFTQAFLCS